MLVAWRGSDSAGMKQAHLDDLRDVTNSEELLAAFMRIGNALGFPMGTVAFRTGAYSEQPVFHSVAQTLQDNWRERASDRELSMADPVFARVNTSMEPFFYGPDFYAQHGAGELWDIGAQYGYKNGPAASLHLSPDRAVLWGFDTDEPLPSSEAHRIQLLASTQLVGVYMYAAAERLLAEKRQLLTERQKEILRHVRSGRSSWVISSLTDISPETVNYHMKNIRAILGVSTRVQAIDKAIALGLLD